MLIPRVMSAFVARLVEEGGIALAEGASQEALVAELIEALGDQGAFAQLGPFLSATLIASDLVDELFLDDPELTGMFNNLGV